MQITWHNDKIRLVPALVTEACVGCLFHDARDIECPRPKDGGRKYCYTSADDNDDDFIWIEDSELGMADYILAKMTGELPEE